jgi:hypothetical protein
VCPFIESPEEGLAEDDGPDAIIDGLEPDELACEGLTDKLHAAFEFDFASRAHTTDFEIARILRIDETIGIGPG